MDKIEEKIEKNRKMEVNLMAVNAYFKSKNNNERQISNLAYAEFYIDGRFCHSLEGFYQGIKRSGEDMQNKIFQSFGNYAKKLGKPTEFIYFGDLKLRAGSKEHHELIFRAQVCKYTQCKKSREALISTGDSAITHNVGRDSKVYPAKVFCKHLTTIRSMIAKGEI